MPYFRIGLNFVLVAAAFGYFVAGRPAMCSAASATTNMNVTASVTANCSITSPAALAFGAYDPVGANRTANLDAAPFALQVQCTKGAVAQVTLNLGSNAQGTTRRMVSGGSNYLQYEIYTSDARTTIWNLTNPVTYTASSSTATGLQVFGRIPFGQDAPAGATYSDTIVATINF